MVSSVFFYTPEVTKIVLPKVLQNFKLYLLTQGTDPKGFFYFPRNTQYRATLKGNFFGIVRLFLIFFHQRVPFNFSKLNVLSMEAEEIGQTRIAMIELNRYRKRIYISLN